MSASHPLWVTKTTAFPTRKERSAADRYIYQADRWYPNNLGGYQVQDSDTVTAPTRSFLSISDSLGAFLTNRWTTTEPLQQPIMIDQGQIAPAYVPIMDSPANRTLSVFSDGTPVGGSSNGEPAPVVRNPGTAYPGIAIPVNNNPVGGFVWNEATKSYTPDIRLTTGESVPHFASPPSKLDVDVPRKITNSLNPRHQPQTTPRPQLEELDPLLENEQEVMSVEQEERKTALEELNVDETNSGVTAASNIRTLVGAVTPRRGSVASNESGLVATPVATPVSVATLGEQWQQTWKMLEGLGRVVPEQKHPEMTEELNRNSELQTFLVRYLQTQETRRNEPPTAVVMDALLQGDFGVLDDTGRAAFVQYMQTHSLNGAAYLTSDPQSVRQFLVNLALSRNSTVANSVLPQGATALGPRGGTLEIPVPRK